MAPSAGDLRSVVFHYRGIARSVCIVGDFNQWSKETHCLEEHDGEWSVLLRLPKGPAHYAFIVDGKRWVLDPKAIYVENDGFGKQNSVVMIE